MAFNSMLLPVKQDRLSCSAASSDQQHQVQPAHVDPAEDRQHSTQDPKESIKKKKKQQKVDSTFQALASNTSQ